MPNISGTLSGKPGLSGNSYGGGFEKGTGCFSGDIGYKHWDKFNGYDYRRNGFVTAKFNANNSSPIYGNSNTVQPSSIKLFMWQRIA